MLSTDDLRYYTETGTGYSKDAMLEKAATEIDRLRLLVKHAFDARMSVENELLRARARINSAPIAIMDTRDALGICAPREDGFPALYALQGKRVRLVLDDVPNV